MSASDFNSVFQEEPPDSDSRETVILIIDGPGDTTVRPATPPLLQFLIAERERILRWQKLKEQSEGSSEGEAS